VGAESRIEGGLVERAEIASGVFMACSLVKVNNGHIIVSILNTIEEDVVVPNPVVKVVELRDPNVGETAVRGATEQEKCREERGQNRGERFMAKLSTDRLK
jgi:hypothetical protein